MSNSPQEKSHNYYSLDEFEEIERLIQENTAPDSEDEERDTTSAADSTSLKDPASHAQVDTGYQTSHALEYADESADPDTTARDDSRISDCESVASSRSSLRRTTHLQYHSESSSSHEDAPPTERSNTEQEVTLIPSLATPREEAYEYEQFESDENKLVATFGTTENFEALLQKQLDEIDENYSDNDIPQQNATKQTFQSMRHSTPAPASAKISFPKQKKVLNRTTRSPAANRARRASQKSRTSTMRSHSPGLADSSDDLSVRSEASRHELRQRLRKAHSEKKREQSITHQLQHDYDDLLTKFAEAENVIDQLRIGAKIDLFASIPSGGDGSGEQPGKLSASYPIDGAPLTRSPEFAQGPHRHNSSSPQRISRTPRQSQDVDSLTENSLKFPAAASTQFLRIALEHQANELREHVESFRTLLNEVDVADVEKRQVLDDISKSLQKLEADYLTAGKDHDAEKRALILSGNASGAALEEFDPDRKIEGEIYKLRKMVDDLRENILLGSSLPQTPVSSRRFQNSDLGSDSAESADMAEDLDAGFDEQLRRYNKMPLEVEREDHTTASSRNLSSDEGDTTIEFPADANSRKSSVSHNSSRMPERFLRPPSSGSASPTKSALPSPNSHAGTSPVRSSRKQTSPNKTDSSFQTSDGSPDSRRPRSRLPRPVGGRSQSTGVIQSKKIASHDMDRDSGFVGSESSRQSYPLKYESMLQRLSPVHSSPNSQRPVSAERKPSKQERKMSKTTPQQVKTSKSPKTSAGTMPRLSDRERSSHKEEMPQAHATSFIPPKHGFKQKYLNSEDGSSTWSSPLKPRPVISKQTFAHGASGDPIFSTPPSRGHQYQETSSAVTPIEKLRPSSRRSAASSSRDSTLDLLRGEIAKLRQEIMDNRAIAEASQRNKLDYPPPKAYASESETVESSSNRGRRSARTRDRLRGSEQDSHASVDSTKHANGKTAKRDAKTGDDKPITTEELSPIPDTSPLETTTAPKGHWEYVPPYFSPSAATTVRPIPAVYSPPVHSSTLPVQLDATYYSPVRYSSPARIYVPVSPSVPVVYNSIPVETRMYRCKGSGLFTQVATQTSNRGDDENDRPLTRSQLNSPKRSSSVPPLRQSYLDPQLSISLQRAERAASSLRHKSRSMYKSLRDSCNRSELASSYA